MKLYEAPKTRSARCRWVLQELRVPFGAVPVRLTQGEHKLPEFLKMNPYGRVPVLVDDDLVLSESIAICLYLADKYGVLSASLHELPSSVLILSSFWREGAGRTVDAKKQPIRHTESGFPISCGSPTL